MKLDIYRGNSIVVSAEIDEKTVFSHVGMGEHQIKSSFFVPKNFDLMPSDYILHHGDVFSLNESPEGKKVGDQFYHNLIFESPEYGLYDKQLKHNKDVEFSYVGTPLEILTLIVDNINEIKFPHWIIGDVDDAEPIKFDFSEHTCRSALTYIAEKFGMEYSFEGLVINLKKSVGRDTTLVFEVGLGKGLYEIERKRVNDKPVYTRVTGYGGTKNIPSDYRGGKKRLMFSHEGHEYIDRNTDLYGIKEGSYKNDNIYPHRTGIVSACSAEGTENQSWWIEDRDLPFNINDQLVEGVPAKLTFTSGDLAGNEIPFEITKYDPDSKRIYFNTTDDNGYILPNALRKPAVGHKYVVTDIRMPQSYVDEYEVKLIQETIKFTEESCRWQYAYPVKPDKRYLMTCGAQLRVFDKVTVKDKDYNVDHLIRIVSLSYPLIDEYNCAFTVAETVPYTSAERTMIQQAEVGYQVKVMGKQQAENARFWAAQFYKMKGLIFDPDGKIQNAFVEAMAACFGSESQNFALSGVTVNANFGGDMTKLHITAGNLVHYTYKIADLPSPNYIWRMERSVVFSDLDVNQPYYLYAKCSKSSLTGEWAISNVPVMSDAIDGFYCFNLGILFQVNEGETYRGFDFTKGNTLICGDQITAGLIQSLAKNFIINLTEGSMYMKQGDSVIDVGYTQTGKIKLKGVVIVSGSGAESVIGCDRGEYNSIHTYYEGDTVTYQGSTYKYIFGNHTKGNLPTDETYWRVIAQKGDTGNFTEYRYAKNGSTVTPPSLNNSEVNPLGWSDSMPSLNGGEYLWMISVKKDGNGKLVGTWSKPVRTNGKDGQDGEDGKDGQDGEDGKPGPGIVNMGDYSASKTYYGNDKAVVVVKYSGQYYISRVDAGSFTDIIPTNTSKWNTFGAQFESIATGLLLAEGANIANFIFRNGVLTSQAMTGGKYNIQLDGRNGTGHLAAGNIIWDELGNLAINGRISTPFKMIDIPVQSGLNVPLGPWTISQQPDGSYNSFVGLGGNVGTYNIELGQENLILNFSNYAKNPRNITFSGNLKDGYDLTVIIRGLSTANGYAFDIQLAGNLVSTWVRYNGVEGNNSIVLKYVSYLNKWFTYNSKEWGS